MSHFAGMRSCTVCGAPLAGFRADAATCSPACRKKLSRRRASLAQRLARDARRLWAHVPPSQQPGDDEPGELSTDEAGHLLMRYRAGDVEDVWRLTTVDAPLRTAAMRVRTTGGDPPVLEVTMWCDTEEVGTATMRGFYPDLN